MSFVFNITTLRRVAGARSGVANRRSEGPESACCSSIKGDPSCAVTICTPLLRNILVSIGNYLSNSKINSIHLFLQTYNSFSTLTNSFLNLFTTILRVIVRVSKLVRQPLTTRASSCQTMFVKVGLSKHHPPGYWNVSANIWHTNRRMNDWGCTTRRRGSV